MKNQQNRRSYVQARDVHGRLWGVTVETSRGRMHAVGPFEPIGWTAPWVPPRQYMDLDSNSHQPKVLIDYGRLLGDWKTAETEYKRRARRVGQKLHGQQFDAKAPPTHQMIEEIGHPPLAWQLVQAAMKGDRYILGLTKKVNEKVARFLPQPDDELEGLSDDDLDLEPESSARRRAVATAGA